ncbi:MAG TPA: hypothetical protein VLG44_07685 [Chlamydiales bacterium]|nr:hypothetical protein [Chlamydiales bacterium]
MSSPALTAKQYPSSEFEALSKEMASWHSQVDAIEDAHYDVDFTSDEQDLSDVAYAITNKMSKRLITPEKEDLVIGALDVTGRLQALAIFSFSLGHTHKCLLHYMVTHPTNLLFHFQLKNRIAGAAKVVLKAIGKLALLHHPKAEIHAQVYSYLWGFIDKYFTRSMIKPEGSGLISVVLTNENLLALCPKEEKKSE